MKILFLGDITGKSGRDIVSSLLYELKEKYQPDLVIANGENSAHGKGMTKRIYHQLIDCGIDYFTMGNHTYSKNEINLYMDELDRLIVPYNHVLRKTENYYKIIEYNHLKICLTNILGNVLMPQADSDPFEAFSEVLEKTMIFHPDFYFVDLHSETTAEKRLFFEYFKKYRIIVAGTHTHVQTADEMIIDGNAFISDVGMCGAFESIIGRDIDESIQNTIFHEKSIYKIADGPAILCGIVIELDEKEKKAKNIERIQIRP